MSQIKLDLTFFLHVFVGFLVTSIVVTSIFMYQLTKVMDDYDTARRKLRNAFGDDRPVDFKIWSHDPLVMQGLAGIRARRSNSLPGYVNLTQINFNDTCFAFVWSKFHLPVVVKISVHVTNIKAPSMLPLTAELGGLYLQYSLCDLNISTPYLVQLTASGTNPGSLEMATGVMWTTHQVPPPPSPPKLVDVTETTISITLPQVILTNGPLTALEVRIKYGERDSSMPEDQKSNSLSRKRRRRALEAGYIPKIVEIPNVMLYRLQQGLAFKLIGQRQDSHLFLSQSQGPEVMGGRQAAVQTTVRRWGTASPSDQFQDKRQSASAPIERTDQGNDWPNEPLNDLIGFDLGSDPEFRRMYDSSFSKNISELFMPATATDDQNLLWQLMADLEFLESYESSEDMDVESEDTFDILRLKCQRKDKSSAAIRTNTAAKPVSSITTARDPKLRRQARVRRSLFKPRQRSRAPESDPIHEAEDRLEVDPFLTRDLVNGTSGQLTMIKTGVGFFVTDHYGVRQPTFNNSALEKSLRRFARYQEARDFLAYGQSQYNLMNLTDTDQRLLSSRLDKVMNANKRRRSRLFLDMFEDFLFWASDRDKRQTGSTFPDPARLGLPPGYPVARVTNSSGQNLTIGNYQQYGGIPNPALEPGREYEVVVAVLSTVADVTKHSWSSVNVTTKAQVPQIVSPFFVVLVGAFFAVCLFVLLLACVVLWCGKQSPRSDQQDFDDYRLQIGSDNLDQLSQGDAMHNKTAAAPLIYPQGAYYWYYPRPQGTWTQPQLWPSMAHTSSEDTSSSEERERRRRTENLNESNLTIGGENTDTEEEQTDQEMILPTYAPEAHWNTTYDLRSLRYLVDKREQVRGDTNIHSSRETDHDKMSAVTFRDEFIHLSDGNSNSNNCKIWESNTVVDGQAKNRFPHIPLLAATRVCLQPDSSSNNSVIHANLISGYCHNSQPPAPYIAAMSPYNPHTVLDFWRLIYQQGVQTIVMMTQVLEDGIIKCAQYWPVCEEKVATLGHFLIQTVQEKVFADFTIRRLKLKSRDEAGCRDIRQFHFTSWPGRDSPCSCVPWLDMRCKVRAWHAGKVTPILVHCGTGVSRTAVFIACDALIGQYEKEGRVRVFSFVQSMRRERPMMVRCLDQYLFIYQTLQEDFEAGNTTLHLDEDLEPGNTIFHLEKGFKKIRQELDEVNSRTGQTYLQDQFEMLNFYSLDILANHVTLARQLDKRQLSSASDQNFSPGQPVFIDGYRKQNMFTLLTTPTSNKSRREFWRFVYEQKVSTIVQLGRAADPTVSSGESWGTYCAETVAVYKYHTLIIRDLRLKQEDNNSIHEIRHFYVPHIDLPLASHNSSTSAGTGQQHNSRLDKKRVCSRKRFSEAKSRCCVAESDEEEKMKGSYIRQRNDLQSAQYILPHKWASNRRAKRSDQWPAGQVVQGKTSVWKNWGALFHRKKQVQCTHTGETETDSNRRVPASPSCLLQPTSSHYMCTRPTRVRLSNSAAAMEPGCHAKKSTHFCPCQHDGTELQRNCTKRGENTSNSATSADESPPNLQVFQCKSAQRNKKTLFLSQMKRVHPHWRQVVNSSAAGLRIGQKDKTLSRAGIVKARRMSAFRKKQAVSGRYSRKSRNFNKEQARDNNQCRMESRCDCGLSPSLVLDLLEFVLDWQARALRKWETGETSPPILMHAQEGSEAASLLCLCALLCERLQEEKTVDVYHVIKHLRQKRPWAVQNFAQYQFLHECLALYATHYTHDLREETYNSILDETMSDTEHVTADVHEQVSPPSEIVIVSNGPPPAILVAPSSVLDDTDDDDDSEDDSTADVISMAIIRELEDSVKN